MLQADKLEAVADRGYFNGEEILACEQAGITVTLPKPMTSGAKSEGRFGKQDFVYLPEEDVYRCPAGEQLKYYFTRRQSTDRNCAATGPMRAGPARSSISARRATSAGSRDGSTSTCSKRCSSGSTRTRKPCASGARRSSIRSARSRCAWVRRTS